MNKQTRPKSKTAKPGTKTGTKPKRNPIPRNPSMKQRTPTKAAAVAYSEAYRGKQPSILRTARSCRVVHSELISSVVGTAAFSILPANSIAINPGLPASFPWLSSIASSWERYKIHRIRYCYYPRCSTATAGSLAMAPDYDAADAAPATEQIMTSYQGIVEDAPWARLCCELDLRLLHGMAKELFIRNGPLGPNLDIKTYDAATLFIATTDGGATNWGKVFVEYDIEFFIPQLPSQGITFGGSINGANTQTAANPFGIAPVVDAQSSGISIDNGSIVTFANAGTYVLAVKYVGTVITAVANPVGVNATVTNVTSVFDGAALNAVTVCHVVALAGGTVAFALTATTVTTAYLRVGLGPTGSMA